jgi:hypothetical protein
MALSDLRIVRSSAGRSSQSSEKISLGTYISLSSGGGGQKRRNIDESDVEHAPATECDTDGWRERVDNDLREGEIDAAEQVRWWDEEQASKERSNGGDDAYAPLHPEATAHIPKERRMDDPRSAAMLTNHNGQSMYFGKGIEGNDVLESVSRESSGIANTFLYRVLKCATLIVRPLSPPPLIPLGRITQISRRRGGQILRQIPSGSARSLQRHALYRRGSIPIYHCVELGQGPLSTGGRSSLCRFSSPHGVSFRFLPRSFTSSPSFLSLSFPSSDLLDSPLTSFFFFFFSETINPSLISVLQNGLVLLAILF